jgi:hypothetical protein
MSLPRDWSDVMLAPVILAVDARLEELGRLDPEELAVRVAIETNTDPHDEAGRRAAFVAAVGYLVDLHGWDLSWDVRGVRLRHGEHTLVLGVPLSAHAYVAALPVG